MYRMTWYAGSVRKEKSFADESEALSEARLKASQLAAGRVEGASMSTGDRDELQAARAIAGPVPLLAALEEWAKARTIAEGHLIAACEFWAARNVSKHERLNVSEVVKRFLAAKAKANVQTEKNHGHIFVEVIEAFGAQKIDTVGAPQIAAWLAKWEHPSTRNTFRKHAVGLWRWAQKMGYLPRELKTEAEQTDPVKEKPLKIGTITPDTFSRLLKLFRAKHPEYLPALVLAGFCGLRRSEVHGQIWADVHLDRKILRVTAAKQGTPSNRVVPLCPAALAWLRLTEDRADLICGNLAMDRIRDIGRDAGFELPENCFRHSWISCRVAQTGDVAGTALEAGNSPAIIFKHYREVLAKAEGEAWFELRPGVAESLGAAGSA